MGPAARGRGPRRLASWPPNRGPEEEPGEVAGWEEGPWEVDQLAPPSGLIRAAS